MLQSNWSKTVAVLICGVALNGGAEAQNVPTRASASLDFITPPISPRQPLSSQDIETLRAGLEAARRGDVAAAQSARAALTAPLARKLVTWAMIDNAPTRLSFFEADQARRDLWGWPRSTGRQIAAEKLIEGAGLTAQRTIDWFQDGAPKSAEGVAALASAYRAAGRDENARALVRRAWREMSFDAEAQQMMLSHFGGYLIVDDHIKRLDGLLYGPQGPAVQAMLRLVPPDYQQMALARIALRQGAANALDLADALPPALARHPGVIVERARYLRRGGLEAAALGLIGGFPARPPNADAVKLVWGERWALANGAMRSRNWRGAYEALADNGLTAGGDLADAEFFAGWLQLTKMGNPTKADHHFERLQKAGSSPITLGRAYYWRGRAAEARGDRAAAQAFYERGARFNTAFYGQLASEKAGRLQIRIGRDPTISPADNSRFDGREMVQAARMLADSGHKDLFRVFVLSLDDGLPTVEEAALLVDLARGYGDQDLGMRVVRAAAQRGFVLPERGYPIRSPPTARSAEPALVLGIIRQESSFDPKARSSVGARGMMQLMPGTAAVVARRQGTDYSAEMLDDPDYNMRLGSAYISDIVDAFSGSYVLATAAYNAGPGRPAQWMKGCGDPRTAGADPLDFIECIPFSETRNYVMRVLEGTQVYRARLNGGGARLALVADLKRSHSPIEASN